MAPARHSVRARAREGPSEYPTLVTIDRAFPAFASRLPASAMGSTDVTSLRKLASTAPPTGALPVVVDAELGKALASQDFLIDYGGRNIPVRVVGVTNVQPSGFLRGPFVYIDRSALAGWLARRPGAERCRPAGPPR